MRPMSMDKHEWHPSPVPGQVVLVTTVASDGRPRVATKSCVSMCAVGPPPVIMFGCNLEHATARNIQDRQELVINIPGANLTKVCWALGSDVSVPGPERFERHGLTIEVSDRDIGQPGRAGSDQSNWLVTGAASTA